jgi:radical SAM superfamily enzyme YgiQ (UPF0313 family)
MKILIVENVWMKDNSYHFFEKTYLTMFSILPSLSARRIAAITPKNHSVELINERYKKIDFSKHYDAVHINFTTSTATRAYQIADEYRANGIKVVLSGIHASALPEEAKKHADSVLIGSGELNWLDFLKDYEKNAIKPLYDNVPYSDRIKIPPIDIKLPGLVLSGAVEATRNCPYGCEFCRETNVAGGSKFYARPIEDVINEIESLPQKAFTFYDASLTIDPIYTKKLFKNIAGIKKRFSCNGNVDVLARDENLVKLSKQAGCVSWLVGFESFNQSTLDNVSKRTNIVEDYKKAVDNIHGNDMVVIGCFMFGFDTDTPDVFDEAYFMVDELGIDAADFLVLTPFPGTPLFDRLKKQNRILTFDWGKYNMKNVVFEQKNMSSSELLHGVRTLYKRYYSFNNSLKRSIHSLLYGLYPFSIVLERNFTGYLNKRRLEKIK